MRAASNARLSEIAAAIGAAQMSKLDAMIARRSELGARYRAALPELAWQAAPPDARPNHQTMGFVLRGAGAQEGARDEVIRALRAREIEASRLSYALHDLPSLAGAKRASNLAEAERIAAHGVAIPMHSAMSDEDCDRVIAALREVTKR